jgi:hypothetical protein
MTYSLYIYKVLKQVHPDTGISNKATVTYSGSYIYKGLKQIHPDTGISRQSMTYSSYIYKVLNQVHPSDPTTGISNKAINDILLILHLQGPQPGPPRHWYFQQGNQ